MHQVRKGEVQVPHEMPMKSIVSPTTCTFETCYFLDRCLPSIIIREQNFLHDASRHKAACPTSLVVSFRCEVSTRLTPGAEFEGELRENLERRTESVGRVTMSFLLTRDKTP